MNLLVDNQTNKESTLTKEGQIELPGGVPALTSLYLYIAGSCNLACRHCWIEPNFMPGGKGGQFIPVKYVQKAIWEAIPLGLESVKLTGGEPTLHPQFREIVELIDHAGLNIHMETNGILIDKNLAQFIKDKTNYPFISVSLDGADAITHEALRMVQGSFNKAVDGIKNLVKVGIHPQLICTLHKGNFHQIKEITELAEDLGCNSVKFNHVQRNGRGEIMAVKEGLTVQELIGINHFIQKELMPKHNIDIFLDIPMAFRTLSNFLNNNLGCCTVLNILGILSGGEVSLCGIGETQPDLIYGNIDKDNLADIWRYAPGLDKLRRLVPYELTEVCSECIHRDLCKGHCVANSYGLYGKINSSYYFCIEANSLNLFPESRRKSAII